jgi:hypothetical protein
MYLLEGIEIINVVGINRLDSHQLPIHRPLADPRNPPSDGENLIRSGSRATMDDPVTLGQKATPG